jgi:predicted nucleic acid-binding Zn ribbon protein
MDQNLVRPCPVCGEAIPPRTHGGGNPKLFCSEKCRKKQAEAKRYQRKKAGLSLPATPKKPPAPDRHCAECGCILLQIKRRFCGQTCWQASHNREYRARTLARLEAFNATRCCITCGGSMLGRERTAKYCSKNCLWAANAKKNSARKVAAAAKWARENPERHRAHMSAIHRRRKRCQPPWLTTEHKQQIFELFLEAKHLSHDTGVQHEVDHIHPLNGKGFCGLHVPWNLQILTKAENRAKSNKLSEAA